MTRLAFLRLVAVTVIICLSVAIVAVLLLKNGPENDVPQDSTISQPDGSDLGDNSGENPTFTDPPSDGHIPVVSIAPPTIAPGQLWQEINLNYDPQGVRQDDDPQTLDLDIRVTNPDTRSHKLHLQIYSAYDPTRKTDCGLANHYVEQDFPPGDTQATCSFYRLSFPRSDYLVVVIWSIDGELDPRR
jgi:hypothetical protein